MQSIFKLWYFDHEGIISTATFETENDAEQWANMLDLEIFKIEKVYAEAK